MTAKLAVLPVDANNATALGTLPAFLLFHDKGVKAKIAYSLQIANHTHAVFCAIALVQLAQPGTGKSAAFVAKTAVACCNLVAVFDSACHTVFRFSRVVTITAQAAVFLTQICVTDPAVHAAGRNQQWLKSLCKPLCGTHHNLLPTHRVLLDILAPFLPRDSVEESIRRIGAACHHSSC
jgi:hypothetical protein